MRKIFFAISIFSVTSCASNYQPVASQFINFQNEVVENDIIFSFRYDVLKEQGNKKYTKKESTKNIKIVAIKVTNNSSEDFIFGQDKHVYSGNNSISLLEPEFVFTQLRQPVPVYLLYLLLTPMQLTVTKGGTTNSKPIGLVIGPGITAINMGVSASANAKFKTELYLTFLNNKTIKAGETVNGLIGIAESGYNPLSLK